MYKVLGLWSLFTHLLKVWKEFLKKMKMTGIYGMFMPWLTPKLGIMLWCSMNPYLSMESRVIALQQVDPQQIAKQPEGLHGHAFTIFFFNWDTFRKDLDQPRICGVENYLQNLEVHNVSAIMKVNVSVKIQVCWIGCNTFSPGISYCKESYEVLI